MARARILVMGIDPGVSVGGGATLVIDPPYFLGTPHWFAAGPFVNSQSARAIAQLREAASDYCCHPLVCVEWPVIARRARTIQQQYAQDKNCERIQAVVRSIEAECIARMVPCKLVKPNEWPKLLGTRAKRGASNDALLAERLPQLTSGMPTRTNVHVRDAAGIAIVGARLWVAEQQQCETNKHGANAVLDALAGKDVA